MGLGNTIHQWFRKPALTSLAILLVYVVVCSVEASAKQGSMSWRAGVSKSVITPQQEMWLAGYASRTKPSAGTIQDLWAKVLVLEDQQNNRMVLVSTDLLGLEKAMSDSIANAIWLLHGIPRANLMLNSSHTHSGPVLGYSLQDIYPVDDVEREKIHGYTDWLVGKIISLVGEAIDNLDEATVFSGNGSARIPVNRRENSEADLVSTSELKGPHDYSVPILQVIGSDGSMKALVFGLACHPTVLAGYEWSGDYAGFAQQEIELLYPNVQAMFFQGAGGDQNPMPRRTLALAKQFGKVLAASVEQLVADEGLRQLEAKASATYKEFSIPYHEVPDRPGLFNTWENKSNPLYFRQWAQRMVEKLDASEPLDTAYQFYPVQCMQLGHQTIFALGGEVVVEYALLIKAQFGQETFVFGYCNDLMGYIPTERILEEGGYEGDDAQKVYGLPAKWAPGIERRILMACAEVYNTLIGMN